MSYLIVGFGFWFLSILLGLTALQFGRQQSLDSQTRAIATRFVAGAIMNQIMDTGQPPTSLATAAQVPGYQDLRLEIQRPWQGYAVSPVMNDGTWQYQRAVVYSQRQSTAVAASDYLAKNACGTTAFSSAGTWCGDKNSYWWLYDSRFDYTNQITLEKSAQRRILQKFARAYEQVVADRQAFPNPGSASATLAALVGYHGSASTCTGTFLWDNVPIDCTDLFSVWGTPRVYEYLSEDYIALFTTSTITNAAGNLVPVATELDARDRVFSN